MLSLIAHSQQALFIENDWGNPEIFGLVAGSLPPTHSSR
jgi:hypothetical protein